MLDFDQSLATSTQQEGTPLHQETMSDFTVPIALAGKLCLLVLIVKKRVLMG